MDSGVGYDGRTKFSATENRSPDIIRLIRETKKGERREGNQIRVT